MLRHPQRCTLFPYTTLFRSMLTNWAIAYKLDPALVRALAWMESGFQPGLVSSSGARGVLQVLPRSEEHTSELQSHVNLVCRLLLEKKNNTHHGGGHNGSSAE